MRLDRRRADRQQLSHLFAAVTLCNQLQHLPLPLRKRIVAIDDAFLREVPNLSSLRTIVTC
jgi:hypothetical protein